MRAIISGMCSVARGTCSGVSIRSRAMSSSKARMYSAVKDVRSRPASAAFAMIRSSTSVMFMTSITRYPLYRRVRRRRSVATKLRKLPMWPRS